MAIESKRTIVMVFDVTRGNPNGDPDNDNRSRTDMETGHGIVSNNSIKRKIRDAVEDAHKGEDGMGIYVQRGCNLTNIQKGIVQDLKVANPKMAVKKEKPEEPAGKQMLVDEMCKRFFDVRAFGAVATQADRGIRGPIQVTDAVSVEPISPENLAISCVAGSGAKKNSDGDDVDRDRNLGSRWIVPYGLYVAHIDVSVSDSEKTGFDEADFDVFVDGIKHMFDVSASTNGGEQCLRRAIMFKHDGSRYGCQSKGELYDAVHIERVTEGPARSYDDYKVEVDMSAIADGIEVVELV